MYSVDEDVGEWILLMEMFILLEERIGDIFQYQKCTKHLNQEFDTGTSLVVPVFKNLPVKAGDTGSIPGPGRFHMP